MSDGELKYWGTTSRILLIAGFIALGLMPLLELVRGMADPAIGLTGAAASAGRSIKDNVVMYVLLVPVFFTTWRFRKALKAEVSSRAARAASTSG